ncbi:MAG: carbonic anhydrase family protein [Burkholderiaceae bacterium]
MPAHRPIGVLFALLALATAAAAADEHAPAGKARPAEEQHDEVTSPARKAKAAPVDPMQTLREKLAARLNAAPAPLAKHPNVVRISTAADAGQGAAATGHAAAPAKPGRAAATKPATHEGHAAHWSYEGDTGPEAWAQLKPEFAKCATGSRQSPIDIRDGIRVELDPVQFDYRPSAFRVIDNGHTVQVNVAAGNSIEVTGRRYELLQFHFHRPSEERIDGRQFDMVAHLVHKDAEGRLAVVAVLLDRGLAHALVQQVWNNLPLERNVEVPARAPIDLEALLPRERRYYTYMGSLTTPPCSEGVLWMVMQQPVSISPEQIDVFSRLYPMNARPIQQAAGRLIKQSN